MALNRTEVSLHARNCVLFGGSTCGLLHGSSKEDTVVARHRRWSGIHDMPSVIEDLCGTGDKIARLVVAR